MNNQLELSREALNNTHELIKKFVTENNRGKSLSEKRKELDEFTIAFNGLSMLMSELDRNRAIELLDKYGILNSILKSVKRIQRGKSLAFI